MKLLSFSVVNFRSITKAHKIDFSWWKVIVLVGKNNEWKSNILKALNLCMSVIGVSMYGYNNRSINRGFSYSKHRYLYMRSPYSWERDFPIWIKKKNEKSVFKLEFQLKDSELQEFENFVWENYWFNFILQISFWKNWIPSFSIQWENKSLNTPKELEWTKYIKNNPDLIEIDTIIESHKFEETIGKVIDFISGKIDFTYIPAIRTEKEIVDLINSRISVSLKRLEKNEEYIEAIKKIQNLQKPIFSKIEKTIKWPIQSFIPDVKDVKIRRKNESIQLDFWSIADLYIDDWIETQLEYKWDGIKSLISISLLHNVWNKETSSLVAIEEPESHLHPEAIHYLKDVIYKLWKTWQIIISTHNPLLVNRENVNSNIIVNNWEAKPAESILQIRNILWIEQSDNLVNVNKVLVVEWGCDVKSLKALLKWNEKIYKAFLSWKFDIVSLWSAWNLSYMLQSLQNSLTRYIVLLDNDNAWVEAYNKAKSKWYLLEKDVSFLKCIWKKESEFEDIINEEIYKDIILEKLWIDIDKVEFSKSKKKRSETMKDIANSQWKPRDDDIKNNAKIIISESIERNVEKALLPKKWDIILEIEKQIERFIDS